ncbi:MAG TPA: IS110 family transposase [Jatrophihabitantaceae bacterium]|nr:IS110 family transposase [Jatrophihabitantaceae bacterium]
MCSRTVAAHWNESGSCADWQGAAVKLVDTETRMVAVLDQLGLTELATSIHGISAVGAAAILAETGDPHRFATGRALVKHAGLAPREKLSGTFIGRTKLSGAGRPGLRLAAWRAVWGTQRGNSVYAARYQLPVVPAESNSSGRHVPVTRLTCLIWYRMTKISL